MGVPQRLQGRLEDPAPLLGLLRPRDVAEELRQKEERQEAERAMARAKEAQEKKKAEVGALSKLSPHNVCFCCCRTDSIGCTSCLDGFTDLYCWCATVH